MGRTDGRDPSREVFMYTWAYACGKESGMHVLMLKDAREPHDSKSDGRRDWQMRR